MLEYNVQYISAEKIIETVECIHYSKSPGATKETICSYLKTNTEYARRASIMASQLGFIKQNKKVFEPINSSELIKANKEQKPILFRKQLQKFDPFILFVTLISKGNNIEDAIRKVKVIYSISTSEKDLRLSFLNWGSYSQLLKYEEGNNSINLNFPTEELSMEYLKSLVESLESDIKTRIYLAEKLTETPFGFLLPEEVEFFVKSLQLHEKDPRHAIDDAGRALEDYLRRLATDKRYDVSGKSGISEIAQIIGGQNPKLIHAKHLHICNCLGTLRVAAAHSKDRSTLEFWKISPDLAIEIILLMISTVRSIHYFVYNKQQIL